jgi:hypothetical protein
MRFSLLCFFLLTGFLNMKASPDWRVAEGRENVMVVYAEVVDQEGRKLNAPSSLLGAFEWGITAGVTPVSTGPNGMLYQLRVGSDTWESQITYQLYDSERNRVLKLRGGPSFVAGSIVGSIVHPVRLSVVQENR